MNSLIPDGMMSLNLKQQHLKAVDFFSGTKIVQSFVLEVIS